MGWDRADIEQGPAEMGIAAAELFRRVRDADWFCLCGSIDANDKTAFSIGMQNMLRPEQTGELCLFANDCDWFYGNNFGKLIVTVRRRV